MQEAKWKIVWSLNVPQCVGHFIWVVFKGCLFTNAERCRRGLSEDPSCKLCGNAEKSCIYVIWDCPKAKEMWIQFIPSRISDRFFTYSLEDGLSTNLVNKFEVNFQDAHWPSLFGIVCWKNWKQRNVYMFQYGHYNIVNLIHFSWLWARSIKQRQINSKRSNENRKRNQRWAPPPVSFFKINTGGARNLNLSSAWSALVARYEHNNWMWRIERSIKRCSVLQAELWVIYDDL